MRTCSAPRQTRTREWSTLALLAAAVFSYSLLEAMIVPALPLIQDAVDASPASIAWVFTGLLLAAAVSTPVVGRLADVRDKRAVFLGVMGIVAAGVVTAALAESAVVLAVGQALQGVGLGLVPLSLGIIRDTQPAHRVTSATGVIVGASALSTAAGLVVAGPLTERLPYTWVYWIPLALLAATVVCAWRILPSCPPALRGTVDWPGAALLGAALLSLLVGVTQAPTWGWTSSRFLTLEVVAVVLAMAFVAVELRSDQPLVPLRVVGKSVAAICLTAFVIGYATTAVYLSVPGIVAAPRDTGYGLALSTTAAGLILLPLGVMGTVAAPLTGRLEQLLGARAVTSLSTAAIAASCGLFTLARQQPALLAAAAALLGIGVGCGLTQAMNSVVATVPTAAVASVAGLAFVVKSIGGTLGGQVSGSLLADDLLPRSPLPAWAGYTTVFAVAAAVGVMGVACAVVLTRRSPQPAAAYPGGPMDTARAQEFLRTHHRAVLSTFRKNGQPQLSPVVVALDGTGRVVLSTTETRAKCRNLRRDPRVSACVFTDRFYGAWIQVEGTAEILPPDEGFDAEALTNLHHALNTEYGDWETFKAGIHAENRVAVRFAIDHATGTW